MNPSYPLPLHDSSMIALSICFTLCGVGSSCWLCKKFSAWASWPYFDISTLSLDINRLEFGVAAGCNSGRVEWWSILMMNSNHFFAKAEYFVDRNPKTCSFENTLAVLSSATESHSPTRSSSLRPTNEECKANFITMPAHEIQDIQTVLVELTFLCDGICVPAIYRTLLKSNAAPLASNTAAIVPLARSEVVIHS